MQEFKFLNKKKIIPGRLFEIKQKSFKKFKDAITATEGLSGLGDGELSCLLALIEGKVDMIATDDKKTRGYIENNFLQRCINRNFRYYEYHVG
ncbi:MAG: hypothetical protein KGY75_07920 [Candidatus Cloacimonetes bacterium]|nr:hypothetical protein [Candidatus Cloacimonadota bacterium]MBS3768028.1 hypothetical protein [Candidatus Cloacimonadota bacterium]